MNGAELSERCSSCTAKHAAPAKTQARQLGFAIDGVVSLLADPYMRFVYHRRGLVTKNTHEARAKMRTEDLRAIRDGAYQLPRQPDVIEID